MTIRLKTLYDAKYELGKVKYKRDFTFDIVEQTETHQFYINGHLDNTFITKDLKIENWVDFYKQFIIDRFSIITKLTKYESEE